MRKTKAQTHFKILSTKCVYKSSIFDILNNLQVLIRHKLKSRKQTN